MQTKPVDDDGSNHGTKSAQSIEKQSKMMKYRNGAYLVTSSD